MAPQTPVSRPSPEPQTANLSKHPAIQTYRDVFHAYPQTAAYKEIVDRVGADASPEALAKWREDCKLWMMRGWNPKNIVGLLDMHTGYRIDSPANGVVHTIDGITYMVYPDGSREQIIPRITDAAEPAVRP